MTATSPILFCPVAQLRHLPDAERVVRSLSAAGATVQSLSAVGEGVPDLLVGYRGTTYLLEVKDGAKPPSARELTPAQIEWHVNWTGGSCVVVNSADEALAAIGATNG